MYQRNTDIGHFVVDRNASAKYSDLYSSPDKKYFIKGIKAKEITDNILNFEFLKRFHQPVSVQSAQDFNNNSARYEYSDKDIDDLAAKLVAEGERINAGVNNDFNRVEGEAGAAIDDMQKDSRGDYSDKDIDDLAIKLLEINAEIDAEIDARRDARYEYSDKDIDDLAAKLVAEGERIDADEKLQASQGLNNYAGNASVVDNSRGFDYHGVNNSYGNSAGVKPVDISRLLIDCKRIYFIICDKFLPHTKYLEPFYYDYSLLPKYSRASVKLLNEGVGVSAAGVGAGFTGGFTNDYKNDADVVRDRMNSNMESIMDISGSSGVSGISGSSAGGDSGDSAAGELETRPSDREARIITGKEYVSMLSEFSIKNKDAIDAMFLIYRGAESVKWVMHDDERAIAVVKFLKEQVELTKEPEEYVKNQGNILSMIMSLRVPDRKKEDMVDEMKVILSQAIMNIVLSDIYALRGNMTENRDKDKEGKAASMEEAMDGLIADRKNGAKKVSNESFWMGI